MSEASRRARQPAAAGWIRRTPQRIGIRELRQHASVYVDLAEKGQIVEITNRGRLVARLVPASDPESPLERLIVAGVIAEPEGHGDLLDVEPAPPVPPGRPAVSEVLLRMREEERTDDGGWLPGEGR
jgi:prevent-host-death family protein